MSWQIRREYLDCDESNVILVNDGQYDHARIAHPVGGESDWLCRIDGLDRCGDVRLDRGVLAAFSDCRDDI